MSIQSRAELWSQPFDERILKMANNLHISYDLKDPDRNYAKIIAAIQQLGSWAKIHYSYWYVDSNLTAAQALNILMKVTDSDDSIYVVDATNNTAACNNISIEASNFIKNRWYLKAA
jgi:hypothetical protein